MRLLIMHWFNYLEFYMILTYSMSAAAYDSEESESCYCVVLADCPPLLERLIPDHDPKDIDYLNNHNCGYVGLEPKVCCPETPLFFHYCVPEFRSRFESVLRSKLLPDKACGISSIPARRSYGGKDAKLGAYPWMARLVYINPDNSTSKEKCGGSLINTRFVLTAAHCLIDLPFEMELVAVRLGEHDIRYNPDCEGQICADPPQDFKPLSVIPHRDYDLPIHRNDIGLIRLDREAMITRWVSPICLPYKDMGTDYTGFDVTAAGWGNINQEKMSSPVLQEVTLKVVDISNCTKIYSTRYSINIGSSQFCTKGQNNKDTCYGDSGGPLMRQRNRKDFVLRYFLLGFVITGPNLCGFPTDVPAIATKVVEYLDWILYTIDDDCKK